MTVALRVFSLIYTVPMPRYANNINLKQWIRTRNMTGKTSIIPSLSPKLRGWAGIFWRPVYLGMEVDRFGKHVWHTVFEIYYQKARICGKNNSTKLSRIGHIKYSLRSKIKTYVFVLLRVGCGDELKLETFNFK